MSTMDGSSRRWAAASPSGGDVAYRMQSLTYRPVEVGLDESVPFGVLFRLWLGAAISAVIVFLAFMIVLTLTVVGGSGSLESVQKIGVVGTVASVIAFFVVLLGSGTDEPIDEWKTLIEGKEAAAPSAYAAIYASLRRRRIPVDATAMRIRSDVLAPEVVNNRLVITERGGYVVYASVFAYGSSLYVGWMMWRSRRGAALIGQFLKDLIGGILGRSGSINQMLRTERVRAMREAVHSAVREGADVAIRGIEVPLAQTFGHDIPVEDLRSGDSGTYSVPRGYGN